MEPRNQEPGTPSPPNRFLDPNVLAKITRLDLRARHIVEGFIAGQHRSPYHGFAVEFASHREYVPGDEIRHIDWKVWSKTDRLYIKEHEEETNLNCTIVMDCSRSMEYGGVGGSKFDYAATLAASLTFLLQRQQDAVGLVTFDTQVRQNLPPRTHSRHLKLILQELAQVSLENATDTSAAFQQLAEQIRKRSLVILISDLLVDVPILLNTLNHFRYRRHEMIVFHVLHQDELTFPFQLNTRFRGLENETEIMTQPRALRRSYLDAMGRFLKKIRAACTSSGIDYVQLSTADPLDAALARYLAFRQRSVRASGT